MTSSNFSKELRTAIKAAKLGANEALKYYDRKIAIELKTDNTIVTHADVKTEKIIKNYLLSKYPNTEILAEESGGKTDVDELWIVDPIDGTRSFSRGVPNWAVLIAYYKKPRVQVGVCYFPVLNSILWAERGKGAYLDGKQIHVSLVKTLKDSYAAIGSPRHFKDKSIFYDLIEKTGSLRSPDATYAHSLVAKGGFDFLIDAFGKTWDFAPFKVIIEEAGGKITRMDGSPWTLNGQGCISSNGLLHNQVLSIVNKKK